jgi:hypothetical protein
MANKDFDDTTPGQSDTFGEEKVREGGEDLNDIADDSDEFEDEDSDDLDDEGDEEEEEEEGSI